jgi:hypothetical protein
MGVKIMVDSFRAHRKRKIEEKNGKFKIRYYWVVQKGASFF